MVTDRGLEVLAEGCRGLRSLNIREVQGVEGWGVRALRRGCRGCVIEHSLPGL